MKKVITLAALASVALSADFLNHHPALVKKGIQKAKDIKVHNYERQGKDGVQIFKDLHLEDQEFFSTRDIDILWKKAQELMVNVEKQEQAIQKRLVELKETDPAEYERVSNLKKQMPSLADVKKMVEFFEKLVLPIAKNPAIVLKMNSDQSFQEFQELLIKLKPFIENQRNFSEMQQEVVKIKTTTKELKNSLEQMEKEGEAIPEKVGYSNKVKTFKASQIQVDDEELFLLGDHEFANLSNNLAEDKVMSELRIQEFKKMVEDMYEKHRDVIEKKDTEAVRELLNKVKVGLAKEKEKEKEIKPLPTEALNNQKIRKIQIKPDESELFTLGRLIKDGKGAKEDVKNRHVLNRTRWF